MRRRAAARQSHGKSSHRPSLGAEEPPLPRGRRSAEIWSLGTERAGRGVDRRRSGTGSRHAVGDELTSLSGKTTAAPHRVRQEYSGEATRVRSALQAWAPVSYGPRHRSVGPNSNGERSLVRSICSWAPCARSARRWSNVGG